MEAVAAAASSAAAFMAGALWRARAAQRAREEESRASREASEGALVLPIYAGRGRRLRRGAHNAWSSGGEHDIRVSPMGPAIEHLARAMEPEFRRVFQHIPGSFGSVGLYQSCCAQAALQLLLRVHRH